MTTTSHDTEPATLGEDDVSHRVIVGVDSSPASTAALQWAAADAARRQAPLHIVHAWKWQRLAPWETAVDRMVKLDLQHAGQNLVKHFRTVAVQQEHDLVVTTEVRQGPSAQVLTDLSREAGLIVLGTHHLHGLGRAVLGSTTSALATYSACPVLVVSPEKRALLSARPAPHAVVLGLNGSRADEAVLRFGFEYAEVHALPVRAVYAWHPDKAAQEPLPPPAAAFDWLHDCLLPWRRNHPELVVEATVRRGHPVAVLMDVAEADDLLVVGRGTHTGLRAHLGSVGLGLLHHVACSVAVVPSEDESPADAD